MTEAWIFPGQGSQAVGMGRDLHDRHPEARAVFEEADAALGFGLAALCFEGPEAELRRTEVTQPALLTVSAAALAVLRAAGRRPAAVAGHSLGEYSALVAAGVLRFADAVRIVRRRGAFMQEAVPEGEGGMAAILGLDAGQVAACCEDTVRAGGGVVQCANLNAAGQVVIAGTAGAVEAAGRLARERGARRVLPLNVSAPFHCALMEPAARRLEPLLAELPFVDAACPVWTNVDARPETRGEALRSALIRQVAAPVRWEETVRGLGAAGHTEFLEVGPGTVLAGLVRRTLPEAHVRPAGDETALAALATAAP